MKVLDTSFGLAGVPLSSQSTFPRTTSRSHSSEQVLGGSIVMDSLQILLSESANVNETGPPAIGNGP